MAANHIKNVTVVGAGGRMGSYIISSLLSEGKHKVSALTRPDSTSQMPRGVNVKKADYSSQDSLTSALEGEDALIITMSAEAPADSSIKLVEAAAAARVPYIMPNSYGIDGTNKKLAQDTMLAYRLDPVTARIEELGVSKWVALACSFWYEWSLSGTPMGLGSYMYGFDLKNKSVTFFDDGETKINTSTWPLAGLAVARAFALKIKPNGPDDRSPTLSQYNNKYIYVSSFLLNQQDMLQSVLRVQGSKESEWKIKYEPSKQRYEEGMKAMKEGNRSGFVQQLYSRVLYNNGDGNFEKDHPLANEVLGLPKEDLDQATVAAFKYGEIP